MKRAFRMHLSCSLAVAFLFGILATDQSAFGLAQEPYFTYQGQLQVNGAPANGNFNLGFAFFDAATGGAQQGGGIFAGSYPVTGGLFTIDLPYVTTFNGTQLWLEVTVNGVTMSPRTEVLMVPVAQYSLNGAIADGSVTRAKLAGKLWTGTIGLTLPAGGCALGTITVSGFTVGDLPIMTFNGNTPPTALLFGPLSVTAASTIKFNVCNMSGSSYSNDSIPVTIQTFR